MPFNPQAKIQSNWCQNLLAKFVKQEEEESFQKESLPQNQNIEIAQGKWEDDQNLKFIVFIDFHSKIFSSKQKRKSQKIFKILSKYLGNRTPAQCRSHYQKVMIKFKTIAKLKKYYKQYFGDETYNRTFKQFVDLRKQLHVEESTDKSEREIKEMKETGIQTDDCFLLDENMKQFMIMWQMQQMALPFFCCPYNYWTAEKGIDS